MRDARVASARAVAHAARSPGTPSASRGRTTYQRDVDGVAATLRRPPGRQGCVGWLRRTEICARGGGVARPHSCGPRNRSPLKWIRWSAWSAHQASVSQAMSARYFRISLRDGKHDTYTSPAVQSAKSRASSPWRFPSTGPWLDAASISTSHFCPRGRRRDRAACRAYRGARQGWRSRPHRRSDPPCRRRRYRGCDHPASTAEQKSSTIVLMRMFWPPAVRVTLPPSASVTGIWLIPRAWAY